ncbi:MAG: OmpA family protein [Elusimicrobia bacterium]|nr:OmpA family protein [Elusimicrobiota bacterium]
MKAALSLLALALAASASDRAPLLLAARERIALDDEMFEPPVVFTLRTGEPDQGVSFSYPADASALGRLRRWQIQVLDRDGRKVSFIQGVEPPEGGELPWWGLSPDGRALPEGFYRARLVWVEAPGRVESSPEITVSLFVPPSMALLADAGLRLSRSAQGLLLRVAEGLVFPAGAVELLPAAVPALTQAARLLQAYRSKAVLVRGYTDASGSRAANLALSRARAQAVCRYFVEQGVDAERLRCEGRGAGSPIASNDTAEGRTRNRRVEIVLLRS